TLRPHLRFHLADDLVCAGKSKMFESGEELAALAIEQAEVQMGLGVVRETLDGAQQVLLRLVKLPLFEEDQPEVGVENENVRILVRQPAIDDLSHGEGVGLEVHQSEEIEHIGVVRAKPLRI